MANANRYAMLLSSLPYHGRLFGATQTPLSRIRLDQRLAQLAPADAECLRHVRRLAEWAQQDVEDSDAQVVARIERSLGHIGHAGVRDLVIRRLELRTLVAALRRRHRGEPAPRDRHWGYGRWVGWIGRHWNEPEFGLARAFSWLPEAKRLLERGASADLERLLASVAWNQLEQASDGHHFDFAAVAIYALRWDMIASWTSYDGEGAIERFDELIAAASRPMPIGDLGPF
ncbi:DUF2764 family protein [Thioalkalicoccus limnaeus]|uniref:DUF2764 family protein n=1 Tax=Thioalkalicoccus limnaeus TaxID=120681 RepID=A0ABV4BI00_9GAMM